MNTFPALQWNWFPSVLIGFTLWTLAYELLTGPFRSRFYGAARPSSRQRLAFHAGTLIALLALVSPLDELGDEYLFSAHMLQHLLLMFGAAPLWVIGLPGWLVDGLLPALLRRPARLLTQPLAAYMIFAGVMFIWHIPAIYRSAQENEALHIFEHLSFMGAAMLGWWPVWGADTRRLTATSSPVRVIYTFLLSFPCTALAALLTFASAPLYPLYAHGPLFAGLSPIEDQRLGGLMMWFPTHMVILLALGFAFFRWLSGERGPSPHAALKES